MQSKFGFGGYFIVIFAILFTALFGGFLSLYLFISDFPLGFYILLAFWLLFVWLWIVWGEMRTKAVSVDFGYDNVTAKGFAGFGKPKTYYFNDLDGFKTAILPASAKDYEYLYLMSAGKKVIKLSEFYHRNYAGLKDYIVTSKIRNLGEEKLSYKQEIKEIFK